MMKNLIKISFIGFLFTGTFSFGQDNISASRPGQCLASSTINKGTLQLQTGVQSNLGNFPSIEVPTTLLRYGLFDGVEIRVYDEFFKTSSTDFNLINPQISFLANITKGTKLIPELAIQPYFGVNIHKNSSSLFSDGGIILSGSNSLKYNFGYAFNLGAKFNGSWVGYYAFNVNYTYKKSMFFIETYGDMQASSVKLDAGTGYLLTPNVQIDLYGGADAYRDYFVSLGVSARLLQKH